MSLSTVYSFANLTLANLQITKIILFQCHFIYVGSEIYHICIQILQLDLLFYPVVRSNILVCERLRCQNRKLYNR